MRAAVALALVLALATVFVPATTAGTEDGGELARPQAAREGALTSGGSFYVEWWPEPTPVPLNEMFAIGFRVLAPDDRATLVSGAALTARAWMPEHNHGTPLEPRIEAHGDGTFTGHGFLLQMEGHWELRVGVAADGRMERAVFDIELAP
ncbi:MAG TPA: hypothetical protein VHQ65_08630 [Thermoanaerobaculia bacterium]|nr:hypothetical protein [Thermoanaerobaculia bacterium]